MDPYHRLVWEAWMPSVRRAITDWNPRNPDPLINFLETWRPLIPLWIINNLLEQWIVHKIKNEVEIWNPCADTTPIHVWIHPWFPLMGVERLDAVFAPIRQKLGKALADWHPRDRSAKLVLQPWVGVFSAGALAQFISRHIVPRLELALQQYQVNPAQQNMEAWNWTMDWLDMAGPAMIAQILQRQFFPKVND